MQVEDLLRYGPKSEFLFIIGYCLESRGNVVRANPWVLLSVFIQRWGGKNKLGLADQRAR
jgi:hypothetical protein